MSNSFKNPLVPLLSNPIGIDRAIQELQQSLADGLYWLSKSYGRAWPAYRKDSLGKTIVYPQVWQGLDKDLLNVMPNDNLNSQSFFKVEDPANVIDYAENMYTRFEANVSIIFWYNLKRIDPGDSSVFNERLKAQVKSVITNNIFSPGASLTLLRVWDEADNVFKGYTIDKVADQTLVYPYGGFRFESTLQWQEDCPIPT